jgi:hypothetical protein
MALNKNNIYVYVVGNLLLLIGEDTGQTIKNCCRLKATTQGPAFTPLFVQFTENQNVFRDIEKKKLSIIASEKPIELILNAYIKLLTEGSLEPRIYVPKKRLN